MRGKFRMWDYIVPPPRRRGLVQPRARMTGVGTERHTNYRERHWICDEWDMGGEDLQVCGCHRQGLGTPPRVGPGHVDFWRL